MAALFAPFMTGLIIDALSGPEELINGLSALVGAVLEMPGTLGLVWISFYTFGRLARGVSWQSIVLLLAAAAMVGGCVALFRLDVVEYLDTRRGQIALGVFLFAGALTGAAYTWLIWFWDRVLKELSKKQNGRPFGRPFA